MKLGKIVIIGLLLLVLTVGAVSAEGNSTQTDSEIASQIDVSFPEKVYDVDDADIEVTLPDAAQGRLVATVDDVEIYNETITDKVVRIPITIPATKSPIYVDKITDHESHSICLFYNDIALNITHDLKIMYNRPDYDYRLNIEEIIKADDSYYQSVVLWAPLSANGTVDVYIDGEFKERLSTTAFTVLNISNFNSLSLGNHTLRIVYSGDDYYNASDRTFNFTVVEMYVQIPHEIVLDHDDCVVVKLFNHTDGTVYVYVDSELVLEGKLDEQGEFLQSLFKYVKCGEQEIEIRYVADNFTKSKKALVNVSYYVDCWGGNFIYGNDNRVNIIVPTDFKKEWITITIDGVEYDKFTIDNSGWIYLDVSDLSVGNHTVHFDFAGNEKYNNYTLTHNFTIYYGIMCPEFSITEYSIATITLPESAQGSLEVYVDGKLYATQKLVDGKASIGFKDMEGGKHVITARYTGDDFEVRDAESTVYVPAKVSINATGLDVTYPDIANVSVKIMRGSQVQEYIYVSLKIGDETFDGYTDEDGIITFEMPKLDPGKYLLEIACGGVKVKEKLTVTNVSDSNGTDEVPQTNDTDSNDTDVVPAADDSDSSASEVIPQKAAAKTASKPLKAKPQSAIKYAKSFKAKSVAAPSKVTIKMGNLKVHFPNAKFSIKIMLGSFIGINKHVVIKIAGMTLEGYTNESGDVVFELPDLDPGEYNITVICDGTNVTDTLVVE